jgi:threonine/homoserine/homoserine lactone efflux protein
MWIAALVGFVMSFFGSIPIAGPVALLVFDRGRAGAVRTGLHLAVGAASAESVYAYLACWGFSRFLTRYSWVEPVSRVLAALILTVLGSRLLLGRSDVSAIFTGPRRTLGDKGVVLFGFSLSALNPALLANWTAAMSMVYASGGIPLSPTAALPFAVGVWCGIVAWFALLLRLMQRYRSRVSEVTIALGMRVMGGFVTLLGLWFALRLLAALWLSS